MGSNGRVANGDAIWEGRVVLAVNAVRTTLFQRPQHDECAVGPTRNMPYTEGTTQSPKSQRL